jgi:hypothetical protein
MMVEMKIVDIDHQKGFGDLYFDDTHIDNLYFADIHFDYLSFR